MPETRPGRWAVAFAGLAFVAIVVAQVMMIVRQASDGDDGAIDAIGRAAGPVIGAIFGISGLGALVLGSFALLGRRDRSLAVRVALGYGVVVLLFFVGEFVIPH